MKALYAGSFDPFTIGHFSIAKRALGFFDQLVIGVGFNENKRIETPIEERVKEISKLFVEDKRVIVKQYRGLTAEFARSVGAGVLIRGLRNVSDFEKEKELADINREVLGIDTLFLVSDPSLSFVSSSMVRELRHNGFNADAYIASVKEE